LDMIEKVRGENPSSPATYNLEFEKTQYSNCVFLTKVKP